MDITGLNKDLFLINNPIMVDITNLADTAKYVEVLITDITNPSNQIELKPLRFYTVGSSTRFNIQDVIKGAFPIPNHPANPVENSPIETNYRRFRITILEQVLAQVYTPPAGSRTTRNLDSATFSYEVKIGDQATFTKTFIRGGERSLSTNITLSIGETLKTSEKLPKWAGYPLRKYFISASKTIDSTSFVSLAETDYRKVVGCDPMYVRFLNDKGGYSFWLFESWENTTKVSSYPSLPENKHLGGESKEEIKVETTVPKEYFNTIRSLLKSPEIYLYNRFGKEWARVVMNDNSFMENNYETTQRIEITFGIILNEEISVLW